MNLSFELELEFLVTLFDRCLIYDMNETKNFQGENANSNVVFDFFLFQCSGSTKSELDLIENIFASGRNKLLEHPIFEVYQRLKWESSKG